MTNQDATLLLKNHIDALEKDEITITAISASSILEYGCLSIEYTINDNKDNTKEE